MPGALPQGAGTSTEQSPADPGAGSSSYLAVPLPVPSCFSAKPPAQGGHKLSWGPQGTTSPISLVPTPINRGTKRRDGCRRMRRQKARAGGGIPNQLLPKAAALAEGMTGGTAGAHPLRHRHADPAARAARRQGKPASARGTQGDTKAQRRHGGEPLHLSSPFLPGWQAVKSLSPWLGCQGDRASWGGSGEVGSGSRTPRGREHRGAPRGTHKGRVVRCQAGSQALGGQHEAVGSHGQPSGPPPAPGQEQTPRGAPRHLQPCSQRGGLRCNGKGSVPPAASPTSNRGCPSPWHSPARPSTRPLATNSQSRAAASDRGCKQPPPAPAGHPGVTTTLAAAASRCLVEPLLGTAPVQQGVPTSPRRIWQAAPAARAGAGWSWQPRGQPSSLPCTCTDSAGRAQAAPGCAPHGA